MRGRGRAGAFLQVFTADYRGAGTDADVYVTITGDEGEIEEFKLSSAPENFSRGRHDKFKFDGPVIGPNKTLTFRLVRLLHALCFHVHPWARRWRLQLDRAPPSCCACAGASGRRPDGAQQLAVQLLLAV